MRLSTPVRGSLTRDNGKTISSMVKASLDTQMEGSIQV